MVKQWKRSLSGADVQVEVEDALEKDISQMDPASNSVAANLDGGVAAVDWSSKTPKLGTARGDTFSVSGSGYLTSVSPRSATFDDEVIVDVSIDSSNILLSQYINGTDHSVSVNFLHRFDSSLEVTETENNRAANVIYVLD